MNIWYLSAYDQPNGHSTRTYDFSKELVRLGHKVTFFCNSYCHFTHSDKLDALETLRLEKIDGIDVIWLKTIPYSGNGLARGLNMLSNVRGIWQASKQLEQRPDVILGPSVPILTGWIGATLALKYKAAFVYEVRDVWPDALVDMGGLSRYNPVYHIFRYIEKYLYRNAARISSTLPNLSAHVTNSGTNAAKIVWIPNGINLQMFPKDESYTGGIDTALSVMYVGGFGLDHDVVTIIKAAKLLQDSGNSTFHFNIIGNGVRKVQCEKLAKSYHLTNLMFHDPISKSEIPRIQASADILIAAITDSKSYKFGLNLNKLCSYFASARPIIFSGNPPNDPVNESSAGYSIAAEDAVAMMNALLKISEIGPVARIAMGKRGRHFAEMTLSMNVLGQKMENMLEIVVYEHQSKNNNR